MSQGLTKYVYIRSDAPLASLNSSSQCQRSATAQLLAVHSSQNRLLAAIHHVKPVCARVAVLRKHRPRPTHHPVEPCNTIERASRAVVSLSYVFDAKGAQLDSTRRLIIKDPSLPAICDVPSSSSYVEVMSGQPMDQDLERAGPSMGMRPTSYHSSTVLDTCYR